MRSGATPYGSIAHQLPVRPAPHRISSATKSTSCRSQISRIVRKYSGRGVDAPVDEPPTGSAMKAATVSARALDRVLERRAAAGRAGRVVAAAAAAVRVGRRNVLDVDEPLAKGKLVLFAR